MIATLHKLWDVSRYPLDSHVFTIEIEDNNLEADKLIYLPDVENSGLSTHAEVAGWTLKAGKAVVTTNTDHTNYGDLSLPSGHESSWSRFIFSIEVNRPGMGIFIKLFTGLFIATAIALQALRIPAEHVDARLGLLVGAMFAAVASQYLVAAGLPESNRVTMAEAPYSLLRVDLCRSSGIHSGSQTRNPGKGVYGSPSRSALLPSIRAGLRRPRHLYRGALISYEIRLVRIL